jgi:hypothetical protein
MKHTRGPWTQGYGNNVYQKVEGMNRNQGPLIAVCHPAPGKTAADWEQVFANARLIAKAPELLEALEHVLLVTEDNGDMGDIDWKLLQGVVADAKGELPSPEPVIREGDFVLWTDPDCGVCTGYGKVRAITGEVYTLDMGRGDIVQALKTELTQGA